MFTFILIIVVIFLYIGNEPARHQKRLGDENYKEMCRRQKEAISDYCKEKDCYNNPTLGPNQYYYGDGSLKYDRATGRSYDKGQYYCDSRGMKADCGWADANEARPPK